MNLTEVKQILFDNGFICETRGKTNIEDFKKACEKVGIHPNLSDYE